MDVLIRPAGLDDAAQLVDLMADHADYEGAPSRPAATTESVATTLLGDRRRAVCLVAEAVNSESVSSTVDQPARLVGYATASLEFSTWDAADYLHMDTLFVVDAWRSQGLGARLMEAVVDTARRLGVGELQWQTPDWNERAQDFYRRLGAVGYDKTRFRLEVADRASTSTNQAVLDRFSAAWADESLDELAACLHPDVVYTPSINVDGAPFVGRPATLAGITTMWAHDGPVTATTKVVSETLDTIVRRWGYRPDSPPTDSIHGIDVFTFSDGLLIGKDAYRRF